LWIIYLSLRSKPLLLPRFGQEFTAPVASRSARKSASRLNHSHQSFVASLQTWGAWQAFEPGAEILSAAKDLLALPSFKPLLLPRFGHHFSCSNCKPLGTQVGLAAFLA
jgi:hypothetical protein